MYINTFIVVGFYHFTQQVFFIRSIRYRILSIFTRPQTETFMMLRCYLYILSSHLFSHSCPLLCIKFGRIPLIHQFQPFISRYFCPTLQPFSSPTVHFSVPFTPRNGIQSPMNKGSQTIIPEFLHCRILSLPLIRCSIF